MRFYTERNHIGKRSYTEKPSTTAISVIFDSQEYIRFRGNAVVAAALLADVHKGNAIHLKIGRTRSLRGKRNRA